VRPALYIGKAAARRSRTDAVVAAIAKRHTPTVRAYGDEHRIEQWRDRLLGATRSVAGVRDRVRPRPLAELRALAKQARAETRRRTPAGRGAQAVPRAARGLAHVEAPD
jgi:ribosomal 50S subunit-associated protein YjgA (DUF615 family)